MLSRGTRELFYGVTGPPMRINGWIYRNFRAPRTGVVKVHLGPGWKNYMPGWINVDANLAARIDVWANICNALPFRSGTVDVIYSHHMVEHLPDSLLAFHFGEMFRCLKPGGIIRVGGPDAETAAKKLLEGDLEWFVDFPDKRQSIGGRFTNFLMCRGEHLTLLTHSYLSEICTGAGFVNIRQCIPKTQTFHAKWIDAKLLEMEWELTPDAPHTLLVEAEKPGKM